MTIQYIDEYGELIHSATGNATPSIGQSVVFANEEYKVKDVIWLIEDDCVNIVLTQNAVKSVQKESTDSGRLNEVKSAILAINKRQDASEKKGRALNEQIGSIRKHINQRIQQEKKDT